MLARIPPEAAISLAPAAQTRTRVLVDLSHAADGYVGVAQDIRLIFAMLAEIQSLNLTGLLMPTTRHDLPVMRADHADSPALTAAALHWMEMNWALAPRRLFPLNLIQMLQTARQILRNRHEIWRVLFSKTLEPCQRALIARQEFAATDLSVRSVIDRAALPLSMKAKSLATDDYDAVLFCMPRPVRLAAGVRPIMRFHDSVPISDPDTVVGSRMVLAHSALVRKCAPNSIFVCNSPQSRDSLLTIDPERDANTVVIPCAIAPAHAAAPNIAPEAVIDRHMTLRALGENVVQKPAGFMPPRAGMRYILSVSTLEPRKNFPGLIRAFERVAAQSEDDLRLVIVAGRGWRENEIFPDMRPGIESGKILHLQHVPTEELHALMHSAVCFAFPSFNEGFGYSPIEAMQFGTPCVVSDIPVFRWIFGDSAEYVDPYDVASIAAGMSHVINNPAHRQDLLTRAAPTLNRFLPSTVSKKWQNLFENLRDFP